MPLVDIILPCFLGAFVVVGFWVGVVHMLGALVGLVLGIWAAGAFYGKLAAVILPLLRDENTAKLASFIAILVVVTKLVGFVVHLIDKVFKVISIIPFVKTFNRLLGAALGLVEGAFILGLGVWFAARLPWGPGFELALRDSLAAKILQFIGTILSPLLPAAMRTLHSVI